MVEIPRKPDAIKLPLGAVMTFGAFKGKTIRAVADERPSYLVWAIANVPWFELDDEARRYGQRKISDLAERRYQRRQAWAWGCFSRADWSGCTDDDFRR